MAVDKQKNQQEELIEGIIREAKNECPEKDEDGNCLTPGSFSDSDPIGG